MIWIYRIKKIIDFSVLRKGQKKLIEALLGVFGIRDIRGKNYRDTGYFRKKLWGYRILRSSFRDAGNFEKNCNISDV